MSRIGKFLHWVLFDSFGRGGRRAIRVPISFVHDLLAATRAAVGWNNRLLSTFNIQSAIAMPPDSPTLESMRSSAAYLRGLPALFSAVAVALANSKLNAGAAEKLAKSEQQRALLEQANADLQTAIEAIEGEQQRLTDAGVELGEAMKAADQADDPLLSEVDPPVTPPVTPPEETIPNPPVETPPVETQSNLPPQDPDAPKQAGGDPIGKPSSGGVPFSRTETGTTTPAAPAEPATPPEPTPPSDTTPTPPEPANQP